MSRSKFWFIQIALLLLVICGVMLWLFLSGFFIKKYSEGQMLLDNPRRGYYWQVDSADAEEFSELEEQGFRIVFLAFDISGFSDREISQNKLEELSKALQLAKEHHLSVVFRAAYGFEKVPLEPDRLELMGTHIKQIAEILNPHVKDLICVQAGLLGPYGEWHSGKYLSTEGTLAKETRLYLLKQWETYLVPDIQVALRRPRFIREAEENDILKDRLAFHNDALVSTYNDMYTYDDKSYSREKELEWVSAKLLTKKIGGEMPTLGELSRAAAANREFQKLHLSYLNRSYRKTIFEAWLQNSIENQNAEQYIQNHIGYRWFLSFSKLPKQITSLSSKYIGFAYELHFVNSGYAPLDSNYYAYLVIEKGNERLSTQLKNDLTLVSCNGQRIDFAGRMSLPKNDGQVIRVGIKIAADVQECDEKNCIKLANAELIMKDGIHWIAEYKLQANGKFLLEDLL